jgi:3-oxoacyl-(acyl-carrier-protein) synthase
MSIYITSIKQISVQQPLVDDWFEQPVFYSEPYIRAIEPDYKQFFTPNEARRYGKILKRALLVSRQAMSESGVSQPDAIITGTGLGCIENTEIFLDKLVREGEELLNPTHFMQSTHNTISSLVAIDSKCNAYNSTYAHKGISFECALQDAFMQLQQRKDVARNVSTALVGAHDEMTPAYFMLLKKAGYLGKPNQTFAGETAVAMMLSTKKSEKALCEIEVVEKVYTGVKELEIRDVDYIMVGTNGVEENDKIYFNNCSKLFPNVPLLQYKHIFGEGYTMPALGIYAAAVCLQKGGIPEHLFLDTRHKQDTRQVNKILCYNQFEGKNHTFVLLSKSNKS